VTPPIWLKEFLNSGERGTFFSTVTLFPQNLHDTLCDNDSYDKSTCLFSGLLDGLFALLVGLLILLFEVDVLLVFFEILGSFIGGKVELYPSSS
jgi:hypothetical protein